MIQIHLLGRFSAQSDDGSSRNLRRKSECLICLIALSDGLEVTREMAAGLIWSDRGEDQARASLRQELAVLRRTLGDGVIVTTKRSIRLDPDRVSIDVIDFRLHAVVDSPQSLEVAATLYAGPLMEGHDSKSEGFEDWVAVERRAFENEALGVTMRLAQQQLKAGFADQAGKWAELAIRIDPLREKSHLLAIEALAQSGDRAAAIAKFADFEALMKAELGVGPGGRIAELGQSLKNGEDEIWHAPAGARSVPASVLKGLFSGRAAVAVLPFRCLSSAEGDTFFADGVTEDVVNGLAAWRWFPVIGRYTTDHYREASNGLDALASETGARYVIDGSIRRAGSKFRVTKFQSGHSFGTSKDNVAALAMFRDAAARDPNSSDALSGIATCHWHDAINSWSPDPAKSGESASRRAKQAIALDSTNYVALGTISIIQTFGEHDIPTAEVTAREALDMNPSDIVTRHYLVCSLEFGGKFDEAIEQCSYMMALNPRAPGLSVLYGDLSTCLLLAGKAAEAVEYSHKSMVADPSYARGRQRLIAALVAAGERSEAKAELETLQAAMPAFGLDYVRRTYPFVHEKHLNMYLQNFAELGVS